MKLLLLVISTLFLTTSYAAAEVPLDKDDLAVLAELTQHDGMSNAAAIQMIGLHYLNENNPEKAEFCYREAIRQDPTLYESWFSLGIIHIDDPEIYFKKTIELSPKYAEAYYWLAYHYCRVGRIKESIKYFQDYLKVVDRSSPVEEARIRVAADFIKQMESGVTNYETIINNQIANK